MNKCLVKQEFTVAVLFIPHVGFLLVPFLLV